MTKDEKMLYKFVNEPKYRAKALEKSFREEDAKYKTKISLIKSKKKRLANERIREVNRIKNLRWEKHEGGILMINRTEGKVRINNNDVLFSDIKGASMNMQTGFKITTIDNSKSKKHASLGGAVLGGIVAGPVGAVAGGIGLGKTKTKGSTVSNQIPTCTHMGVIVDINGFCSEITILSSEIAQSSMIFESLYEKAQRIISLLNAISNTPVPSVIPDVEEEKTVKEIDRKIEEAEEELRISIGDKPKHKIPSAFRSKEQDEMTDEEYLMFLKENDIKNEMANGMNTRETKVKKSLVFSILFVLAIVAIALIWAV